MDDSMGDLFGETSKEDLTRDASADLERCQVSLDNNGVLKAFHPRSTNLY